MYCLNLDFQTLVSCRVNSAIGPLLRDGVDPGVFGWGRERGAWRWIQLGDGGVRDSLRAFNEPGRGTRVSEGGAVLLCGTAPASAPRGRWEESTEELWELTPSTILSMPAPLHRRPERAENTQQALL